MAIRSDSNPAVSHMYVTSSQCESLATSPWITDVIVSLQELFETDLVS